MTLRQIELLAERHAAREKVLDMRAGIEWKEVNKATSEEEMFETMIQFTDRRKHLPS